MPRPVEIRAELGWAHHRLAPPAWLQPYLEPPLSGSPPLAMTPVHPESVGSYGPEAIEWIEVNVLERGRPLALRWWQRLAIVRQLEHREDGSLVWRTVVESTPRRAGKSVRLRGVALWRTEVGPDLFGEDQLSLFAGKDLGITREIHRKAWGWAEAREGWAVRKGVGQEEVSLGESRWLVRSVDSVYGFDVSLGMVDEAWAVAPTVVTEGLEPATLERESAQVLLTSTAHRKATSLMRGRISSALAAEDGETLLLWWGAAPDADAGDPETWRLASPHWSEDRARTVEAKYTAALAGQADPEADDPDPMAGFVAQYLNRWPLRERAATKGEAVIEADAWAELEAVPPIELPDAVAVESWHAEGVAVALAWRDGEAVTVSVQDHPDLASAAEAVRESGYKGVALVGASLVDDPALKGVRKRKATGRTGAVVQDLGRLLAEGVVRHDGGELLTGQLMAVRTQPGADGPRMASTGRADAVKAALWAVQAARKTRSGGMRIVLPTDAAS